MLKSLYHFQFIWDNDNCKEIVKSIVSVAELVKHVEWMNCRCARALILLFLHKTKSFVENPIWNVFLVLLTYWMLRRSWFDTINNYNEIIFPSRYIAIVAAMFGTLSFIPFFISSPWVFFTCRLTVRGLLIWAIF